MPQWRHKAFFCRHSTNIYNPRIIHWWKDQFRYNCILHERFRSCLHKQTCLRYRANCPRHRCKLSLKRINQHWFGRVKILYHWYLCQCCRRRCIRWLLWIRLDHCIWSEAVKLRINQLVMHQHHKQCKPAKTWDIHRFDDENKVFDKCSFQSIGIEPIQRLQSQSLWRAWGPCTCHGHLWLELLTWSFPWWSPAVTL